MATSRSVAKKTTTAKTKATQTVEPVVEETTTVAETTEGC